MKKINLFLFLAMCTVHLGAQTTVTFPTADGLTVTAAVYVVNDTFPYMVLCHQAGYSRSEYNETAMKFTKFGYNCIAIDARKGEQVNDVVNQTVLDAKAKNKPLSNIDAEQDMIAGVNYAYEKSKKKVILVGSSYSAGLAIKIGASNDKVKAVLSFSPGEYFGDKLKLKDAIASYDKPLFVTSALSEAPEVTALIKDIKSPQKTQFIPTAEGVHGSKALWKSNPNYHEYWIALLMFMNKLK